MLREILINLYERDLEKLKLEISEYSDESNLWLVDDRITNSGGNLCQHLIGNLKHFFGAVLGNSGYVRARDLEFLNKNTPRAELLAAIDETKHVVVKTLNELTDKQLEADYPVVVFEDKVTTAWFAVHLSTHLAYHLGQINYHRRFLDK